MESGDSVGAHTCGSFEQRDSIFNDLFSMLSVSGLFAVHGNIRAYQEAGKKFEEAEIYGTDMRDEVNLW